MNVSARGLSRLAATVATVLLVAAGTTHAVDATPSLRSFSFDGGNDGPPNHTVNNYDPNGGGSLSSSYGVFWGHASDTVSYGGTTLSVFGMGQSSPGRQGAPVAYGQFQDAVIFNNSSLAGQGGTADFTYHLSGDMGWTGAFGQGGVTAWVISVDGSPAYENGSYDFFNGTHKEISDLSTFTISRPFTFGQPLYTSMKVEGYITTGSSDMSTHISLTLTLGGITVRDSGGSAAGYSSTAASGNAQSVPIGAGSTYAGFTLTNSAGLGVHHSTVSLLGGTASASGMVTATFLGTGIGGNLASDAVDLSGTQSDLHVVQIGYDEAAVLAAGGSESSLNLVWYDQATGTWVNAIGGDSDGGAASQSFVGAYNPATEFALGNYGVDPVDNTVWAVVNHNGEFAAATPAPEPGAATLLAGALGLLLGLQRFRRARTVARAV